MSASSLWSSCPARMSATSGSTLTTSCAPGTSHCRQRSTQRPRTMAWRLERSIRRPFPPEKEGSTAAMTDTFYDVINRRRLITKHNLFARQYHRDARKRVVCCGTIDKKQKENLFYAQSRLRYLWPTSTEPVAPVLQFRSPGGNRILGDVPLVVSPYLPPEPRTNLASTSTETPMMLKVQSCSTSIATVCATQELTASQHSHRWLVVLGHGRLRAQMHC